MASLFEHPESKFFWVQYRGADRRVHRKSTKIPKGTIQARREALKVVAEMTSKELTRAAHDPSSEWKAWVDGYSPYFEEELLPRPPPDGLPVVLGQFPPLPLPPPPPLPPPELPPEPPLAIM
jgi:hypothetical protein